MEGAEKILEDDHTTNLAIGRYGAEYLRRQEMPILTPIDEKADMLRYFTTSPPGTQGAPDQTYRRLSVLTHCNTGYVPPIILQSSFGQLVVRFQVTFRRSSRGGQSDEKIQSQLRQLDSMLKIKLGNRIIPLPSFT